jgi:hypothetical protein
MSKPTALQRHLPLYTMGIYANLCSLTDWKNMRRIHHLFISKNTLNVSQWVYHICPLIVYSLWGTCSWWRNSVCNWDSVHCEVQAEPEETAELLAYTTYCRTSVNKTVPWVGLKTETQPIKEVLELCKYYGSPYWCDEWVTSLFPVMYVLRPKKQLRIRHVKDAAHSLQGTCRGWGNSWAPSIQHYTAEPHGRMNMMIAHHMTGMWLVQSDQI